MARRKRGSRGGKRVQRGLAGAEAREEELAEEEFDRLTAEAFDLYSEVVFEYSGLRPLPRERARWEHFILPLPNEWFLEMTAGGDGSLMPPGEEEGDGCIFWLITPDGLYAAEESVSFDGAPDETADAFALYACRLLWRHFDEIMGGRAATKNLRKGLPRPHDMKIKALVDRGDFVQPTFDEN